LLLEAAQQLLSTTRLLTLTASAEEIIAATGDVVRPTGSAIQVAAADQRLIAKVRGEATSWALLYGWKPMPYEKWHRSWPQKLDLSGELTGIRSEVQEYWLERFAEAIDEWITAVYGWCWARPVDRVPCVKTESSPGKWCRSSALTSSVRVVAAQAA
jgi:hypothetical protein